MLVQVYIEHQPEKFPNDDRTIEWIESLKDQYSAVSLQEQWLEGTLAGTHPKSITGNVNTLQLKFNDTDAKDHTYAALENVRYDGWIRDMCTEIQTMNE